MKLPKFTDEELESYVDNNYRNMTGLEQQLAQTILDDRASFRRLLESIEPLAAQIVSPRDNVFSRQSEEIKSRLP